MPDTTNRFIIGLGCRAGTTDPQIDAAVRHAFRACPPSILPPGADPLVRVDCVATLDAKALESGLQAFCVRHALPLRCFTQQELRAIQGPSAASAASVARFGLTGVCEPAALLASPHHTLLLPKQALGGVTVAIGWADAPQEDSDAPAA